MVTTEPKETRHEQLVGTRPVRPDGIDKVTGRARYGGDIVLPGMLYGRVKRSPHAHARIVSIDASRALALKGVMAIATATDLGVMSDEVAELGETISTASWLPRAGSSSAIPPGRASGNRTRSRGRCRRLPPMSPTSPSTARTF